MKAIKSNAKKDQNIALNPIFLKELSSKYASQGKIIPEYFVNEKKRPLSGKLAYLDKSLEATQSEIKLFLDLSSFPKTFNSAFNSSKGILKNLELLRLQVVSDDKRTQFASFGNAKLFYHTLSADLSKEADFINAALR